MQGDLVQRLRDRAYGCKVPDPLVEEAADEIERLRFAIRRLAEQDATLSVQGGRVTVTMDATLTDTEREAMEWAIARIIDFSSSRHEDKKAAVLRGLLKRLGWCAIERTSRLSHRKQG